MMDRLNLFELGETNGEQLSKQLDDRRNTLNAAAAERLQQFCSAVKERGGVSVNMKPQKLFMFLESGRYFSAWELAAALSTASLRTVDEEFRIDQGAYYERRKLFEDSFVDGELFLYGALNIGGAGASEYGIFCAFLDDELMAGLRNAFLPNNSLELYVKPAVVLALDEPRLRRDVASPTHRHCLAAIKHESDVANVTPQGWAQMICCRDHFVEAVFVGAIAPQRVKEFRVKSTEILRLHDLGLDDMLGKLDASDRVELDEYNKTMTKLEALGLAGRLTEV